MTSHYRTLSPSRARHSMVDPMRASTGMVQMGSSYDPYESTRHYYDDYPSDAGYASAYGHRSSRPSKLEAHPVSSHRVHDPNSATKKRTEYTVTPRHRSNTTSGSNPYETPTRLAVPSSSHQRLSPVLQSSHGHASSPLVSESGHHLVPASALHPGHRRIYSTDYASDTGHLGSRDKVHHRNYDGHRPHAHAPSHSRRYPAYNALRKGDDIDDFDAYSYTTPREQFDRDYPVQARSHKSRHSLDRPLSITGAEDNPQWLARRDRHHGPPPTSWGLDKISRDRQRSSTRTRDDSRDRHRSKTGLHDQALVPVAHDSEDEYTPRHSEHGRRRRHHRSHRDDSRDPHYPEDRYLKPHDGERAAVGLGTAALGGGYSDVSDYERPSRRRHRHHEDRDKREHGAVQAPSSREIVEATPGGERTKQSYLDPADANRHGRSRRHSRQRAHSDAGETSDEDLRKYRREPSASAHRKHSSEDTSESDRGHSRDRSRRSHQRDHSRGHRSSRSRPRMLEDGHASETRRSPPIDHTKDDPRRPVTVDPPVAPKEPEAPPKGILKAPRPAFPEERNPVREGVAPLKDAHKQGIPPGARWTKIDRRLVNPEALEAGNERFEERSDYVIVLRVLSKEEIQAYATKTQEVRETRRQEYLRDKRQHRDETQRHGRRGEESSSDDEDEGEDELPKKLEAPPASNEQKPSLPMRPHTSNHSLPEPDRPRMSPSVAPA
ncbi:uncharacterized protein N7511_000682 [Penicillium nucicola]|uniref:uncharacterized protein n=1 Tax=Penicillium nucicola TaxID=1850975 RepID=UPI002545553F|nr:uncharacterized protein N7511_000682 [Penicillium nucicola]KAJ5775671.1 hypothetical protein N7511_000682 [Penicillium nucicola]